jgi:hypothetical protein
VKLSVVSGACGSELPLIETVGANLPIVSLQ